MPYGQDDNSLMSQFLSGLRGAMGNPDSNPEDEQQKKIRMLALQKLAQQQNSQPL